MKLLPKFYKNSSSIADSLILTLFMHCLVCISLQQIFINIRFGHIRAIQTTQCCTYLTLSCLSTAHNRKGWNRIEQNSPIKEMLLFQSLLLHVSQNSQYRSPQGSPHGAPIRREVLHFQSLFSVLKVFLYSGQLRIWISKIH